MPTAKGDPGRLTEAAFQRQVMKAAKLFGWKCVHYRPAVMRSGKWATPVGIEWGEPNGCCYTHSALSTKHPLSERGHVMATGQSTAMVRDVVGFPGYRVGDDGSVWAARQGQLWRKLRPALRSGYPRVVLYRDGKRCHRTVHRLVLESFVGPCPPGMEACHADGNPSNSRLQNLRWDTKSSNAADIDRHGRRHKGSRKPNAKLCEEDVLAIRIAVAGGESLASVASRYGIFHTTAGAIVRGQKWSHAPGPLTAARPCSRPGADRCVNGHPRTEGNVYRNPRTGHVAYCIACRQAGNQRARVPGTGDPVREALQVESSPLPGGQSG